MLATVDYIISTCLLIFSIWDLPGFFEGSPRVAQNVFRPNVFFLEFLSSNAFGGVITKRVVYTLPESLEDIIETDEELVQVR